jgi:hypothetical protein
VRHTSAPKALSTILLSRLIVAGIMRIALYPFTAAINATAMPVLPLVGSMSTVCNEFDGTWPEKG